MEFNQSPPISPRSRSPKKQTPIGSPRLAKASMITYQLPDLELGLGKKRISYTGPRINSQSLSPRNQNVGNSLLQISPEASTTTDAKRLSAPGAKQWPRRANGGNALLSKSQQPARESFDPRDPKAQGTQIKTNLVLSAVGEVVSILNKQVTLSKALEQNKYIWAKTMCKAKPLQDLINDFTHQIQNIIKREVHFNREKVDGFMKVSRPPDSSIADAKAFVEQTIGGSINVHRRNHGDTLDADDTDFEQRCKEESKHALAMAALQKVKDAKTLLQFIINFLVPEGLALPLQPTEQWLEEMASENSKHLVSFHHKKTIMNQIQEAINKEVARKRLIMEMTQKFSKFNAYIDALDRDCCNVWSKEGTNEERAKQPQLIRQLQFLYRTQPEQADELVRSKAVDYVVDWDLEEPPEHQDTLKKWHEPWKDNQSFEKTILAEARGYHLEMIQLRRHFALKYQCQVEKTSFHIEALEVAHNQKCLENNQEIERLSMRVNDFEADQYRRKQRTAVGGVGYAAIVDGFLRQRQKFGNVREAMGFLDELRDAVRQLNYDHEEASSELKQVKAEVELTESRIKHLVDENESKTECLEWFHQIALQGSAQAYPLPYMTQETKKKLDFLKSEHLYDQYLLILSQHSISQKVLDDIQRAKIFSIIVFTLNEQLIDIGLLEAPEKALKGKDIKKYQFKKQHLLELHGLFKQHTVIEAMQKLSKDRLEMLKFKPKNMLEMDAEVDPKRGKNFVREQNEKKQQEKYQNLKESDFKIKRTTVKDLLTSLDLSLTQRNDFSVVENISLFVDKINSVFADAPPRTDYSSIELQDIIKATADNKLIINNMKFALYWINNRKLLDNQDPAENDQEMLTKMKFLLQSIQQMNKYIQGWTCPGTYYIKPAVQATEDQEVQCTLLDQGAIEKDIEDKVRKDIIRKNERNFQKNKGAKQQETRKRGQILDKPQDNNDVFKSGDNNKEDAGEGRGKQNEEKSEVYDVNGSQDTQSKLQEPSAGPEDLKSLSNKSRTVNSDLRQLNPSNAASPEINEEEITRVAQSIATKHTNVKMRRKLPKNSIQQSPTGSDINESQQPLLSHVERKKETKDKYIQANDVELQNGRSTVIKSGSADAEHLTKTASFDNSFDNNEENTMECRLTSDLKETTQTRHNRMRTSQFAKEQIMAHNQQSMDTSYTKNINVDDQYSELLNQIQMDQILLRDKYEFFPRQQKMKATLYDKTKNNYEKLQTLLQKMLDTNSQEDQNGFSKIQSEMSGLYHTSRGQRTTGPLKLLTPTVYDPKIYSTQYTADRDEIVDQSSLFNQAIQVHQKKNIMASARQQNIQGPFTSPQRDNSRIRYHWCAQNARSPRDDPNESLTNLVKGSIKNITLNIIPTAKKKPSPSAKTPQEMRDGQSSPYITDHNESNVLEEVYRKQKSSLLEKATKSKSLKPEEPKIVDHDIKDKKLLQLFSADQSKEKAYLPRSNDTLVDQKDGEKQAVSEEGSQSQFNSPRLINIKNSAVKNAKSTFKMVDFYQYPANQYKEKFSRTTDQSLQHIQHKFKKGAQIRKSNNESDIRTIKLVPNGDIKAVEGKRLLKQSKFNSRKVHYQYDGKKDGYSLSGPIRVDKIVSTKRGSKEEQEQQQQRDDDTPDGRAPFINQQPLDVKSDENTQNDLHKDDTHETEQMITALKQMQRQGYPTQRGDLYTPQDTVRIRTNFAELDHISPDRDLKRDLTSFGGQYTSFTNANSPARRQNIMKSANPNNPRNARNNMNVLNASYLNSTTSNMLSSTIDMIYDAQIPTAEPDAQNRENGHGFQTLKHSKNPAVSNCFSQIINKQYKGKPIGHDSKFFISMNQVNQVKTNSGPGSNANIRMNFGSGRTKLGTVPQAGQGTAKVSKLHVYPPNKGSKESARLQISSQATTSPKSCSESQRPTRRNIRNLKTNALSNTLSNETSSPINCSSNVQIAEAKEWERQNCEPQNYPWKVSQLDARESRKQIFSARGSCPKGYEFTDTEDQLNYSNK